MATRGIPAQQAEAAPEDDPWQTGTGMAADFVGYISEPFFGVDEKYNADAMLFCATLIDPEGEPVTTLKYSVGADWEASADGSEITHPNKTKINNSSRFGLFIDRIAQPTTERAPKKKDITSPAGKENGLGLGPTLRQRGDPLHAASFDGLGFFWQLHKMPTMGTDENNQVIYRDVLLPTEYIGTWDEAQSGGGNGQRKGAAVPAKTERGQPGRPAGANPRGATARAAATTAAAPAQAAAAEEAETPELPPALQVKLTRLAQSSDVKTFVKAAARDKEVTNLPDDVMAYVLTSGENGFWASVQ